MQFMNTMSLDQLKDKYYGEVGTSERNRIERELEALRIGLKLRTAREKQSLTQEEVARRINKKRTFISKVENDGEKYYFENFIWDSREGIGRKIKNQCRFLILKT